MNPRITHHASRFTALCVAVLALTGSAWADVAPPEEAPGSNISPGGQTQVVMAAERVVIEAQPSENSATGKVTGDFTMRNTGATAELLNVRFPLGDPSGLGNGFGGFPTVENFVVQVGGSVLPTKVITTTNPAGGTEPVKWAAFDVNFPAGQDTPINVTYNIKATGNPPSARFAYVLETGAGWKDAIGSADIVLRLPYAATNQNVFYNDTTPGSQLAGNEVRWHWDNLEPTSADNLFVTILAPKAWQAILDARAGVQAKPDDAGALATLARAYDAAITSDFPLESHDLFATLSEETYDLATVADPNSAPLHVEYARSIWKHIEVPILIAADDPNLRRVLAQIGEALTLDPQNVAAKELLAEIQPDVEGTIVVPTAVSNIQASPTPQASTTAKATPTVMPTLISKVTIEAAPTVTVPLPVQTIVVRPAPPTIPPVQTTIVSPSTTVPGAGTSQSSAGNTLLLVLAIITLPLIAALATFLLVSRRRSQVQ